MEDEGTTAAALASALKWAGTALLVVASPATVYLVADVLGEWAAWAAHP